MPLITDERSATEILIGIRDRYPEIPLKAFAREILGAHSEQGRRLSDLAERGELPAETQTETVSIRQEINGTERSITLKAGRLPITSFEELVEFYEIDLERWKPTQQLFNFWGNESSPNFQVKANFCEVEYKGLEAADREAVTDWFAALSPQWEPTDGWTATSGNLLEIVISDLHADKLTSFGTSLEQHLERVGQAVDRIIDRADGAYPDGIERVAFVFLGDTFDHEGNGATSNGTPQQVQGDPRESYLAIRNFIGTLVRNTAHLAHVDLYILSGNHDRERAFYAVDSLAGLFREHPKVTVHRNTDRAAIDWGVNLIGLWHGDKQRNEDIAMTLMREFNTTEKRVLEVHLGHLHTRREDEVHGVLLRRFRTPTPDNTWASERLFNHNVKSITGILWNQDLGPVAEFPVTFVGEP